LFLGEVHPVAKQGLPAQTIELLGELLIHAECLHDRSNVSV
jgi:hypothetical protein